MMSKKMPSFQAPRLFFKKILHDPVSPGSEAQKTPTRHRSGSWLGRSSSNSLPIGDFVVEVLGSRSGHLVFGPLSVFNGIVSITVRQRLSNVAVSITFRGLTEFNGKHLAFINETEVLWQGDLEPAIQTYYFAVRFPPVNLPPTSVAPEVRYSFVAQVKPIPNHEDISGQKIYSSKPLQLTFIPYIDPFAPSRYDTVDDHVFQNSEINKQLSLAEGKNGSETENSKPRLQLFTKNLPPPSPPPGRSEKARSVKSLPFPGIEKESIIMDAQDRPMAKLRVKIPKTRFIPGDEISCTISIGIPPGGYLPKGFTASVIERRWLGFEKDEDADLVNDSDGEGVTQRESKSSHIYTRSLTSKKCQIHSSSALRFQKSKSPTVETKESSKESGFESGFEVVEPLIVKLPNFHTFVTNTLLPTASLPLGLCYFETDPVTPISPNFDTPASSIKGKEPIRPVSRRTVSTIKSSHSNIVQGLHLVVQHFLHIEVPLYSGAILKKSSGTLLVDIPITLGNKTPDVDRLYQLNKPPTPQYKGTTTTPDVVVSPPKELPDHRELRNERSKTNFKREPSPLKLSSSAYVDGESRSLAPSFVSGNGTISSEKKGVTFDSVKHYAMESVKWKRGERFPTLEESKEMPFFIKS